MKLSETNVVKTINNFNEIKDKAISLIKEMGFKNVPIRSGAIIEIDNDLLVIRDSAYGSQFKIPISYLLDEEGKHSDEYKIEKEEKDKLELERIKQYLK